MGYLDFDDELADAQSRGFKDGVESCQDFIQDLQKENYELRCKNLALESKREALIDRVVTIQRDYIVPKDLVEVTYLMRGIKHDQVYELLGLIGDYFDEYITETEVEQEDGSVRLEYKIQVLKRKK